MRTIAGGVVLGLLIRTLLPIILEIVVYILARIFGAPAVFFEWIKKNFKEILGVSILICLLFAIGYGFDWFFNLEFMQKILNSEAFQTTIIVLINVIVRGGLIIFVIRTDRKMKKKYGKNYGGKNYILWGLSAIPILLIVTIIVLGILDYLNLL